MTSQSSRRVKLKAVTFTINEKPGVDGVHSALKQLLWCNKVPKGKRNKPAKIMGIQHHEISGSVEHVYYQPLH